MAGKATAGKSSCGRSTKKQQSVVLHPFALLVENNAALPPKGHHGDLHRPSSKEAWAHSQDTAAAPRSSFRSLAGSGTEGCREKTPAADMQGPRTDGPPARGSHRRSQEPPVLSQGQASQARPRRQGPAAQVWGMSEGSALSKPSVKASPQTKSKAAPASSALSRPSAKASLQTKSRVAPASSVLSRPSAKASPQTKSRATPASRQAAAGQRAAAEKQSSPGAGRAAGPSSATLSAPVQQEAGEDFDVDIDLDPEAPGGPLLVPAGAYGGGCEAFLPASALAAFARAADAAGLSSARPLSANIPAEALHPSAGWGDAMSSEDDAEDAEMTPRGTPMGCMKIIVASGSQQPAARNLQLTAGMLTAYNNSAQGHRAQMLHMAALVGCN